jgi:hypothetical protein
MAMDGAWRLTAMDGARRLLAMDVAKQAGAGTDNGNG